MPERWTTEQFEEQRGRLRSVAYRMLGSMSEADDAVQETWLRLQRADREEIENLAAWCTTVVTRVCLNQLRSRGNRREDGFGVHLPDPVVTRVDQSGPEHDAVVAESVGLALLVVLDTLSPAERVAFVLHDVFAMPFDEIASVLGRTPAATRQLASRARRRVQANPTEPDADLAQQQALVDAFFTAARAGDLDGLLRVLDPDVVSRGELAGGRTRVVRGAEAVAGTARGAANPNAAVHPVLVNGAAGVVITLRERPVAVLGFTIRGGRIVAIDGINDPRRIAGLELPSLS
jgi:RNA polymerase sigma factor (sigma-70 family)